ncbi:hypothetical protein NX059_008714 [Plenodomus lindquistii]|nr:hypothetical protein NX059_008714 [Plenodomus lindquistii]
MSDPVTYSFYGTTVPVLRNFATSAITMLTTAKHKRSIAAETLSPTEQEILDLIFADMFPFRMQPVSLARYSIVVLEDLKLNGDTAFPAMNTSFTSFDDIVEFFKQMQVGLGAIDETEYNECAEKSANVRIEGLDVTLHMTGLADHFHGFVIPNSYGQCK